MIFQRTLYPSDLFTPSIYFDIGCGRMNEDKCSNTQLKNSEYFLRFYRNAREQ